MKYGSPVLAAAISLALAACATAPDIRRDRDPAVSLGSYQSFGFIEQPGTDRSGYSTILTAHLKQATRAQLERLGYHYDEAAPQLRVNFLLKVAERQELRSTPAAGPAGFGYRVWGASNLETVNYKAGTLRIDLVDAQRHALVWEAVAEGRLGSKSAKDPAATVNAVVAEMFRDFPGSKGAAT